MQHGHGHRLALTILVAFAGLVLPSQGWALDLADAWQLALENDAHYAATGHARQAEQEIVPQARAQMLPFITASAGAEADDTRRARSLSGQHGSTRALWSLSLTQPLADISAWRSLERARAIARAADISHTQARQQLILRVAQAYFSILKAQDNLNALLAEKRAIEAQLQAAQQGFALGSTTITDTHEAQSRLDLLRAREFEATNAVQVSRQVLTTIISRPPDTLAELPSEAPLAPPEPDRLDDWTDQAADTSLSVVLAQLQTQIIASQRDIAKSRHYPQLHLEARTGSMSDRGTRGTRPDPGPRSLDSSVGIVLSLPIYTGGQLSSEVREQSSRLQQSRAELEAARRLARQSTQEHFSGVTSGLARIDALQAAEQSSQSAVEANQLAYEVGVRINIDVLNAQQQLYETRRQLSEARYDTLLHSLELKASTGTLNDNDLLAINAMLTMPDTPTTTD